MSAFGDTYNTGGDEKDYDKSLGGGGMPQGESPDITGGRGDSYSDFSADEKQYLKWVLNKPLNDAEKAEFNQNALLDAQSGITPENDPLRNVDQHLKDRIIAGKSWGAGDLGPHPKHAEEFSQWQARQNGGDMEGSNLQTEDTQLESGKQPLVDYLAEHGSRRLPPQDGVGPDRILSADDNNRLVQDRTFQFDDGGSMNERSYMDTKTFANTETAPGYTPVRNPQGQYYEEKFTPFQSSHGVPRVRQILGTQQQRLVRGSGAPMPNIYYGSTSTPMTDNYGEHKMLMANHAKNMTRGPYVTMDSIKGLAGRLGGNAGKKVLCTAMWTLGKLPTELYLGDLEYAEAHVDETTAKGYRFWANPLAKFIWRFPRLTSILHPFVIGWATEMAFRMGRSKKGSFVGKVLHTVGMPLCKLIGKCIGDRHVEVLKPHVPAPIRVINE